MHSSVNTLYTTKLYTLNGWTSQYINFISVELKDEVESWGSESPPHASQLEVQSHYFWHPTAQVLLSKMSLHRCLYSGQKSTPVVHSICGDTAQDGAFSILRRYPSLLSKEAPPATPRADLHQSDRASRRHSPMLHLPMSRPNSRDMQAWSSVVPLHLLHCAPVPLLRPATTLPPALHPLPMLVWALFPGDHDVTPHDKHSSSAQLNRQQHPHRGENPSWGTRKSQILEWFVAFQIKTHSIICGSKTSRQGEEAVRKSETSIQEGRPKNTGLFCSLLHTNALGSEGRGLVVLTAGHAEITGWSEEPTCYKQSWQCRANVCSTHHPRVEKGATGLFCPVLPTPDSHHARHCPSPENWDTQKAWDCRAHASFSHRVHRLQMHILCPGASLKPAREFSNCRVAKEITYCNLTEGKHCVQYFSSDLPMTNTGPRWAPHAASRESSP